MRVEKPGFINFFNKKPQNATSLSSTLKRKFGEPKVVGTGSGHQFKVPVGDHNVSITLYKSPSDLVPKMNVQGNKISLKHFVCYVLPEVYKKVSEKDISKALTSSSEDQTHSCNMCDKVYKQKRRLTTHME